MDKVICFVCGKEIIGEYMQASVDDKLDATDHGVVVCSRECATKYEETLPHGGKLIDHYSRITGYYQNVDSWNKGKLQELKDRRRYGTG